MLDLILLCCTYTVSYVGTFSNYLSKTNLQHVYAMFLFRLETTASFRTSSTLTACPGKKCKSGREKKVTGWFSMFLGGELWVLTSCPKQRFLDGCLVIAKHFPREDFVHHPIETNILTSGRSSGTEQRFLFRSLGL